MRSETLNQIVQACGYQAALAITRKYGGRQLSVPSLSNLIETHPIALTIGYEAAKNLAAARGGERLEIPCEVNAILDLRNEQVCKYFDEGASIRQIGFETGLSRKWVRNILIRSGRNVEAKRNGHVRYKSQLSESMAPD